MDKNINLLLSKDNRTADSLILSDECVYSTDTDVTGLNNNVIVVGGSGSGKTMSITEPRLLTCEHSSLIVTVTKRRVVKKYKSLFRLRGYDVIDLNLCHPKKATSFFDPIKYIKSYEDIIHLADAVVKAEQTNEKTRADPYWDQAARSLMSALIALALARDTEATFADVLTLFDKLQINSEEQLIETSLDSYFQLVEIQNKNHFAVRCWKTFHTLPPRTAACVYSTLSATIDTVFTPDIREAFAEKETVSMERLANKKTVLFITTSAVNPALHVFVNLFYATLFKKLFEYAEDRENGELPVPVHVICDDFATGGRVHNFPEYISLFREKKVSTCILLQSESQLKSMYGDDDATTIINNCDTYVFMGSMDIETARNMSVRLNLPVDEILSMPIGTIAVIRRGAKPVITERYNIKEDMLYRAVTEAYERRLRTQTSGIDI